MNCQWILESFLCRSKPLCKQKILNFSNGFKDIDRIISASSVLIMCYFMMWLFSVSECFDSEIWSSSKQKYIQDIFKINFVCKNIIKITIIWSYTFAFNKGSFI